MIDQVLNGLEETKDNIEDELHPWFRFADDMGKSVNVNLSTPRICKKLEPVKDKVASADTKSFYQREMGQSVQEWPN